MIQSRTFTFDFKVAEKPNRWVSGLTFIVVANDSKLLLSKIRDRVADFALTANEPAVLRELRGDIRLDKYSESRGISAPDLQPIYDEKGLKIFAPMRHAKVQAV